MLELISGRIAHEAIIDIAPYNKFFLPRARMVSKSTQIVGNGYVYIAGPVTHIPYALALDSFMQADHALQMAGLKTINPMLIVPPTASWENAMCICISAMLKHCDKIHLLPNWEQSKGATIEKQIADDLMFTTIQLSTLIKTAI